eukprot:g6212.t1
MDTDLESSTEEEEEEQNTKRSQSKKRSRKGKAEKKNSKKSRKKSKKRGGAQDDDEDDAVNKRRIALLTKCLPAILPKLSDKPTHWKKWVAKVNQGRSSTTEGCHSFAKFDKWAASSCRGEDLTEQEHDWRKLQTKHEFQTKRSAILAFLQAFTRTALPTVPFAFTTTHSLEAIEDFLEQPLVRTKIRVPKQRWQRQRKTRRTWTRGWKLKLRGASAIEDWSDVAVSPLPQTTTGVKLCSRSGVRQAWDEVKKPEPAQGTSWDMTALDALPAPKHNQPPLPFTYVGEYLHCCELFTVGSKKAYMEVMFRIFCTSTAEFSFKLENKEEQTLPEKCMLAEVYEIRGAGAFSDSSTFACMGEEECPRLIKRLRKMWTGGDDYKRKLFTSTINAGKLNKVFHGASRLKRAMMAVDISSYAEEEPTDSNKIVKTRRSDQEWEKGYVVEYLRPCLPVEVPTKEDSAGRKMDKGQWHMVHFWGNDYTAIDSFPAKPPIFYPCFQSLKDYKLIFTNVREKKDAYTGKVQDWDLRLGTEIFDNGVRKKHNGKRGPKNFDLSSLSLWRWAPVVVLLEQQGIRDLRGKRQGSRLVGVVEQKAQMELHFSGGSVFLRGLGDVEPRQEKQGAARETWT